MCTSDVCLHRKVNVTVPQTLGFLISGTATSSHLPALISLFQASDTATDDIIKWIDVSHMMSCDLVI